MLVALSLACFGFTLVCLLRGRNLGWPLSQRLSWATVLLSVLVPLLLLIFLTPKFYWENFNGDGAHAFETARLLLFQPFPFWDPSAGEISTYPGVTTMLFAYPASWFVRLFGEMEVSARLPLLLYITALYSAILGTVEFGRSKPLELTERCLIWLGLSLYVMVMAFGATYNPYFADIALPTTRETLLMVCFLGFVLAFIRGERVWIILFIVLIYMCVPNGSLLIGLWLFSVVLLWKPRPFRRTLLPVSTLMACLLIAAIFPHILRILDQPGPGGEHTTLQLLKHFAFLELTDWRRLAFVVVPSGILPALALLAWPRQDQIAKTITLMTILYFVFFYVQAQTALHYFAPVMLLPLIIFWRNDVLLVPRLRPVVLFCTGLFCFVALYISLPRDLKPHTSARLIGSTIEDRTGGYKILDPAAMRHSSILRELIPFVWDPRVPHDSYGGSPLMWYYYAQQAKNSFSKINYVLQPSEGPPPPDMRILARKDGVILYLLSDSVWASHRAIHPSTPAGGEIYGIPKTTLFFSPHLGNRPRVINLLDLLKRLGIDVDYYLERIGAKR
jgi:hypothetical protein